MFGGSGAAWLRLRDGHETPQRIPPSPLTSRSHGTLLVDRGRLDSDSSGYQNQSRPFCSLVSTIASSSCPLIFREVRLPSPPIDRPLLKNFNDHKPTTKAILSVLSCRWPTGNFGSPETVQTTSRSSANRKNFEKKNKLVSLYMTRLYYCWVSLKYSRQLLWSIYQFRHTLECAIPNCSVISFVGVYGPKFTIFYTHV